MIEISKDDLQEIVKEAVSDAMAAHPCFLSGEERSIIKDVAQGGKYVKKSILTAIVITILYAIVKGFALLRGISGV